MRRTATALILALATLVAGSAAYAGDDATSLSYISYLERYATIRSAHDSETLDAVVNMPVLTGDRLDTSRGARVEIRLADGSTVWVDEFSTLDFDALASSRDDPAPRTVLYLADGSVAINVPDAALGDETLRVDSPAGAVFLHRSGLYRLDLDGGQLHVQAFAGLAELPAGMGSELLRGGEEAWFSQNSNVQRAALSTSSDSFWSWVQDRLNPAPSTRTAEVVGGQAAPRAAVLDSYGEWVYVNDFSTWAWRPHVAVGWVPYTYGRWYWTPVGWSWISYEPWGWYPFHYGSWYLDASFGWVWCWDNVWGPAWVDWFYTPGYVGWCPRGYYDWGYWRHHGGWPGHRYPGRWRDVTLDLHGRVALRDIDLRPWTVVRARDFTDSRLDRVRVAPDRFARDLPGDGRAFVRSGPLVTGAPGRSDPERTIEAVFRNGPGLRDVPDLSRVLGRAGGSDPGGNAAPSVPTMPTREVADIGTRAPRTSAGNGPRETARERLSRQTTRPAEADREREVQPSRGDLRAPTTRPGQTSRAPAPSVERGRAAPERGSTGRTQSPSRSPGQTVRPSSPSRPPSQPSPGSGGVRPAPSRSSGSDSRPSSPPVRMAPRSQPEARDAARSVWSSGSEAEAIRLWRNETYGHADTGERPVGSEDFRRAPQINGVPALGRRGVEGLDRPSTGVIPRPWSPAPRSTVPRGELGTTPGYISPRALRTLPRGDSAIPRGYAAAPRVESYAPRSYRAAPRSYSPAPRGDTASPRTYSSAPRSSSRGYARSAPSRGGSSHSSGRSHPRH